MTLVNNYVINYDERIGRSVFKGKNVFTMETVAVKLRLETRDATLEHEAQMYEPLLGGVGIPDVYSFTNVDRGNALVMSLLGPDLETLFNECNRRFSLKTVLLLADQLISLLEYIHTKSLIHGDIKPNHFAIGLGARANQVFVIDLASAKWYRNCQSGVHQQYGEDGHCACTIHYMSINAHEDMKLSRRDDMESLGYVLLRFLRGSLPWEELDVYEDLDKIEQMKISVKEYCPDEVGLVNYFKHVRSLGHDQKPDYAFLRKIFRETLECHSFQNDYLFDWVLPRHLAISDIQRGNDKTTEEHLCDSISQGLSIQDVVRGEPDVIKRMKIISSSLLAQQKVFDERLKLLDENSAEFALRQWGDLVANGKSLLFTYCTLLFWSNLAKANDEIKGVADTVLQRMWFYTHSVLVLMRTKNLPSMDYFMYFVRIAYGCFTVTLDYAPQHEATSIETLGELSRFVMATSVEEGDMVTRNIYARIAVYWFRKAHNLNPKIGRIQHRLGVVTRPDILVQLSLYVKALTTVQPYKTREIIEPFLTELPKTIKNHLRTYPVALTVFVEAHGALLIGDVNSFVQNANLFLSQLDRFASNYPDKFRECGTYIVASNYAAIFDYGNDSEFMRIFNKANHVDMHPAQDIEISSKVLSPASQVAFDTLSIILDMKLGWNTLPSVHVSLAFLWGLAAAPRAMAQIQTFVPWKGLAKYLNILITPNTNMSEIERAGLSGNDSQPVRHLAEDFIIRGFFWSQRYYPQDFFCNLDKNPDPDFELPSVIDSRRRRCLRLGLWLAKSGCGLSYDSKDGRFSSRVEDSSRLTIQKRPALLRQAIDKYPMDLASFITAHERLFGEGDDAPDRFLTELNMSMSFVNPSIRKQGLLILASDYATIFDTGLTPHHRASKFAFATLDLILCRLNDDDSLENMMPCVYLSLVFLWCMNWYSDMMGHVDPHISYTQIAVVLNKLIELDKSEEPYVQQSNSFPHLEEDYFMRRLSWSRMYYSQKNFRGTVESNQKSVRTKRCLFLGKQLAMIPNSRLTYTSENPKFYSIRRTKFLDM